MCKGIYSSAGSFISQRIFTVTKVEERGNAPELMVVTGMVESEFREINRRTKIGPRCSDQCVGRVDGLLK